MKDLFHVSAWPLDEVFEVVYACRKSGFPSSKVAIFIHSDLPLTRFACPFALQWVATFKAFYLKLLCRSDSIPVTINSIPFVPTITVALSQCYDTSAKL